MNNTKLAWLGYGATGETLADVPAARWQPFDNEEAAQDATVYAGYAFAVIADRIGGEPRLTWTQADGWQDARENQ